MSANIPNDPVAIQRFFTSRDNNANASTYVGQEQRLWYDPTTNAIYVSDGNTAGGIMVSGGAGGNGVPSGPTNSIQYNAGAGAFGGTANLIISGNGVSVVGNVTSAYFIGNGSQLTGLPASYGNANVTALLASGTVTTNIITDGIINANGKDSAITSAGNINSSKNIVATGNLTASLNVSAGNNVSAANNVSAGNILTSGVVSAVGNATAGNVLTVGQVSATGNVTGNFLRQTGGNIGIGNNAGSNTQGQYGIAIGDTAGSNTQGINAVAVGLQAGQAAQGAEAVAIGGVAGTTNQGKAAVAIGAGAGNENQGNNSIILNATGNFLNQTTANTFTVKPIRNATAGNVLYYDQSSGEITFSTELPVANGTSNFDISTANGNATITYGNVSTWTFGNTFSYLPTITLPATGDIVDYADSGSGQNGISIRGRDYTQMYWNGDLANANPFYASQLYSVGYVDSAGFTIHYKNVASSLNYEWKFDATGKFTAPGAISTTGNVTANYFIGNGSRLTSLTGGNVTGTVANATYATSSGSATTAGTITTNAQPNITSTGTLTSVTITGNTTSGNVLTGGLISATGNIAGNYFIGNGSQLTGLSVGTNKISNGNSYANIASADGNVVINSNGNSWTFDTVGKTTFPGNLTVVPNDVTDPYAGTSIQQINGSLNTIVNDTYGNVYLQQTWAADSGDIASLSFNQFAGNGNIGMTTGNVNAPGGPLLYNWIFGNDGNSTMPGNASAVGNIAASYFIGNGSQLTNLPVQPGTYGNSNVATFLGDFGSNAISTSGNITASYFIGDGSQLTNITGANVTGTVANATSAGTVTTNAQPNITSTGTLTSVSVAGNVLTGGSVSAAGTITATVFTTPGAGGNISGANTISTVTLSASGNVTANIVNANIVNVTGFVQYPLYTVSALTAITGSAGKTAAVSDSTPGGMLAFWDTTNSRWSYVHDNSAI